MNYIDLFAGAGGLSEGFLQAGYTPVAHIEMNSDAAQTLKTRVCYHYLKQNNNLAPYRRYERGEITREQLYALIPNELINSVINEAISDESINGIFETVDGLLGDEEVDVVIGGPPCQAYSLVGRAKGTGGDDDHRNYLYRLYCRFLKRYHPKMFVFENVPGLLSANEGVYFNNIKHTLRAAGYRIEVKELNAKDFGVLQSRRRLIIIGWRSDLDCFYPDFAQVEHNFTVNDILRDLPSIQAGEENNRYKPGRINPYLTQYGIRQLGDVLTFHIARTHIERDRTIYRTAIDLWNNGHRRLKYTDLPAELITHRNTTSFLDRFKVVEGDMSACHTMLAHISKDGHYFIHPDINQARSLTVREAARIQSFPDNYYFEGSRTAAFTQIGNAVPPVMAKAIAEALAVQIDQLD